MKINMEEDIAVWDGRFQPFHLGHLGVIKAILSQFGAPLSLMVIQSSEGYHDEYSKKANLHHKHDKNPLSLWERRLLIHVALEAEGLLDQVIVNGIHRPDLYWNESVKMMYPNHRFICLTGKDEYEREKEVFWTSHGEKTVLVDVSGIEKISASDFKRAIQNDLNWERFLHPASLEVFLQINGYERFRLASI